MTLIWRVKGSRLTRRKKIQYILYTVESLNLNPLDFQPEFYISIESVR